MCLYFVQLFQLLYQVVPHPVVQTLSAVKTLVSLLVPVMMVFKATDTTVQVGARDQSASL